jgi:cysteinyl-tRNA synthetase
MDFVLWKSAKPGEPFWESPWGKGRPGWHIECSAMSSHFLGETFDIHGGGKDLIFPHHENEIAQSEGAFDRPFARFWMHNGFVNINKEKMSKSLHNFLMIKDVLKDYHPEAVRLFLLSNHYRSPIDFTRQNMDEAKTGLDKIYAVMDRMEGKINGGQTSPTHPDNPNDFWNRFCEAMDDDFNTAQALGVVFETARQINRILDEYAGGPLSEEEKKRLVYGRNDLLKMGKVLGILFSAPSDYFNQQKNKGLRQKSLDAGAIEALVNERMEARKNKDWARADAIRDRLLEMNIVIEDRPEGALWKMKD